jgi:hypothetical protein
MSAAALLLAAACGPSGHYDVQPAALTEDSAGVSIVLNSIGGRSVPSWTVAEPPATVIPSEGPQYQLFGVRGVEHLSTGTVAVANGGARRVLLFDSVGEFKASWGRSGRGPGEFTVLDRFFRCGVDVLAVDGRGQISFFDAAGQLLDTYAHTPALQPVPMPVQGVSEDCSAVLLLSMERIAATPGDHRSTYALYWAALDGTAVDTVTVFPGPLTRVVTEPYRADVVVPFAALPVWTVRNDHVYWGSADQAEIRVYRRGAGLQRVIRWDAERRPLGGRDRDLYERYRSIALEVEPQSAGHVLPLSAFNLPDGLPHYSRLLVDDEGYVWVQEYPRSDGGAPALAGWAATEDDTVVRDAEQWTVFDATGAFAGQVRIPAGVSILTVRGNTFAGLARDALGQESVRIYQVQPR